MAACSSFSFSISAATGKSMSRTSSMSGPKALDTHWSPAEQFALLCCSSQMMLYIPRLLGPLPQGAEIRSSWQSEAMSNGFLWLKVTLRLIWEPNFYANKSVKCLWSHCVRGVLPLLILPLSSFHYNIIRTRLIMMIWAGLDPEHIQTDPYSQQVISHSISQQREGRKPNLNLNKHKIVHYIH